MTILKSVTFGRFIIETGLILRESLFLGSIMVNSEIWYNLTNHNIEDLERIDRLLMKLRYPLTLARLFLT